MLVIVVTRMGFGTVYKFKTRHEADESPLRQYGDSTLLSDRDVMDNYSYLEWPALSILLGKPDLGAEFTARLKSLASNRAAREAYRLECSRVFWDLLVAKAVDPPTSPEDIVRIVTEDRRATRIEDPRTTIERRANVAKRTKNETTETTATGGEAAVAKPKASKIDVTRTIHLLADKDGKQYGAENNPKRAGSAGALRFAHYTDGMTVEQALAAGLTPADLKWDEDHKFIELRGGASTDASAPTEGEQAAA